MSLHSPTHTRRTLLKNATMERPYKDQLVPEVSSCFLMDVGLDWMVDLSSNVSAGGTASAGKRNRLTLTNTEGHSDARSRKVMILCSYTSTDLDPRVCFELGMQMEEILARISSTHVRSTRFSAKRPGSRPWGMQCSMLHNLDLRCCVVIGTVARLISVVVGIGRHDVTRG